MRHLLSVVLLGVAACTSTIEAEDRRVRFVPGDAGLTADEWHAAYEELDAWFDRDGVAQEEHFSLAPAMTAVARLDVTGDGVAELLVTPLAGFCRVSYCFTAIFGKAVGGWEYYRGVSLALADDGLPFLVQRRGGSPEQQVLCTTTYCVAGEVFNICLADSDPLCVAVRQPMPPQRIATRGIPVSAGEYDVAISYLRDLSRVDEDWAADRPGLEAWVAAHKPGYVFYAAANGFTDLLGGLAFARVDLTGDGPRDYVVAQFGTNETDTCDYDGACVGYVVRRTPNEFYSTGEVDSLVRARLALINTGWVPARWVRLRWARDVPDVRSRVEPWVRPILQLLRPNDPYAGSEGWDDWIEVGQAVFFREPELIVHDYLAGGVRFAYVLRPTANGLRYTGNASVTDGFYAKLVVDARGNRQVVGTWRQEIGSR